MSAIKAMVRNGRIETDRPLDLPDGTELVVLHSRARSRQQPIVITPEMAARYAQFATEDIELAEAGMAEMADYAEILERENR